MAVSVIEFGAQKSRNGWRQNLGVLPYLAHTTVALDTPHQFNANTVAIAVIPEENVQFMAAATSAGSEPDANSAPLFANVLREFEVTGGHWIQFETLA